MTSKSDPRGHPGLKLCVHVSVMGYYRFINFHQNRRGLGIFLGDFTWNDPYVKYVVKKHSLRERPCNNTSTWHWPVAVMHHMFAVGSHIKLRFFKNWKWQKFYPSDMISCYSVLADSQWLSLIAMSHQNFRTYKPRRLRIYQIILSVHDIQAIRWSGKHVRPEGVGLELFAGPAGGSTAWVRSE